MNDQAEYDTWRASLPTSETGWRHKYYKGLGTSSAREMKEYFGARHLPN